MVLNILASLVLIWWFLQGAKLTLITWGGPYAAIWAVLQAVLTLLLIIPAVAVWR